MAHLEEDIIERAKNTDMIALLESEEAFPLKALMGKGNSSALSITALL